MKGVKKECLSCKHYRLTDIDNGVCRVDKDSNKNYPTMRKEDSCSRWKDSGQQYYIRLGWIKSKEEMNQPAS